MPQTDIIYNNPALLSMNTSNKLPTSVQNEVIIPLHCIKSEETYKTLINMDIMPMWEPKELKKNSQSSVITASNVNMNNLDIL
jgi:hypothetical protein